jgi:hypothetical protein
MFLLHERTRKSLCRLGFIALCVLPTCAVVLWTRILQGDAHCAQYETELGRALRLTAMVDAVRHPEPGVVRYDDISLADPESGKRIAAAEALVVRRSEDAISVTASKLHLQADQFDAVWELLNDRLRFRASDSETPLRLTAADIVVVLPHGETVLRDLRARIERTSQGQGAQFSFRTSAMDANSDPVVLTIVRSRDGATGVELDSHGAPVETSDPILQWLRRMFPQR